MEWLISLQNKINRFFYKSIFKPIFFQMDPEAVHDRMLRFGRILGSNRITRSLVGLMFKYSHPSLKQTVKGVVFPNPIGLAAGFDKDAQLTNILPEVGFGFAELGSITGEPCEGNPKPRLWRLKKSQGLVIYYGLKNQGCEAIAKRLRGKRFRIPMGMSVAKTNSEETAETKAGIKDYVKAFKTMKNIGAYLTINISCPNAFGGQPFTDKKQLNMLLKEIDKVKVNKPVFIKISPDLTKKQLDELIAVVKRHNIDGFICTNLTKKRKNTKIKDLYVPKQGGLSGKIVEKLANDLIRYVYKKTKGEYIIMGCGGVFTAEDAYKKIKAGACLVQLITGMIFEGPQVIGEINQGLVKLLKKDGYENISEAVGVDNK